MSWLSDNPPTPQDYTNEVCESCGREGWEFDHKWEHRLAIDGKSWCSDCWWCDKRKQ